MPALICCGRRMGVASDDFVIPGALGAVLRAFWLIPMVVTAVYTRFDCDDAWVFETYLYGAILVFGISFLIEVALAVVSSRGRMTDTRARSPVQGLLLIYLFAFGGEVLVNGLGSFLLFGTSPHCVVMRPELVVTVKIVVVSCWLHALIVLFMFWFLNDTSHSADIDQNDHQMLAALWQENIRKFFCCTKITGEEAQIFTDVGKLAAELFHGADLTGSDIGAAFVIMSEQDSILWEQGNKNRDWSLLRPVDHANMDNINYWFRYPLAVYGWLQYTQIHGLPGCCSLYCNNRGIIRPHVRGDNCFSLEGSAMHTVLGSAVEVVLADFSNPLYSTPFFIALDHNKKAVVVSCRGTLSLHDAILDLQAGPEPIEAKRGDGTVVQGYVHRGILKAALRIKNELDLDGTVQRLVKPHQPPGSPSSEGNFRLVICGHSLGAGTATLLSIMLRETYPNLECFAFSPPGGLVSANLVDFTKEYLTSVILDRDWISRLSVESFTDIKNRCIRTVAAAPVAKHRIMCFPLCRSACVDPVLLRNLGAAPISEEALLLPNRSITVPMKPSSSGAADLLADNLDDSGEIIVDIAEEPVPRNRFRSVKLFPPGNVIHLIESGVKLINGKSEKQFRGVWKGNHEFNIITPYARCSGTSDQFSNTSSCT